MSGPHEIVDSRLTTQRPNAPAGFRFKGIYHAAHNPQGAPPYMRRMVGVAPPGTRYDTSLPPACSASDWDLATRGPAACPASSRLGGGSSVTSFLGMFPSTVQVTVFNAPHEQIFLADSPLFATISRGKLSPDGSTQFASPTCYPSSPLISQCPADDVLQLESTIAVGPYTKMVRGRLRSYLTTGPCPRSRQWTGSVRFWWADGTSDTLVTRQPCLGPGPGPGPGRGRVRRQ